MKSWIFAAALAGLILVPLGVSAQQRTDLELRQPRRPTIVHPPTSKEIEIAARDAELARSEIEARTQAQHLSREGIAFPRRPDLGYDVTSGIQSQRINGVLRR